MTLAACLTMVPTFDVELFAKEAATMTLVPPSEDRPTWMWLNEALKQTSVPVRTTRPNDPVTSEVDHRAAFLLLHVDGVSTAGEIVENSGLHPQEALGILAEMLGSGLISVEADVEQGGAKQPASGIHELGSPRA